MPCRRTAASAALTTLLVGALCATTLPAQAHDSPGRVEEPVATVVVAPDGSGDATTVQEAVDLAPTGSTGRVEILLRPGTYSGRVDVDAAHPNLTFVGATGDPRDVVITDDRAAGTPKPEGGTWGTSGSATVTISGEGFQAVR